jgi:DNA-binding protein HU-beta
MEVQMNKAELIAAVASELGETKTRTEVILESIFGENGVILSSLQNDPELKIKIPGFGVFGSKTRKARKARNPKSGETISVPAKLCPTFRFSNVAKTSFQN